MTPATRDDIPAITSLLSAVFRVNGDSPFLTRPMLEWKYFYPRADWPHPRSYVMREGTTIVAHAGLWPVVIVAAGKTAVGAHLIDWAGSPAAPGSGLALLRGVREQVDFLLTIGGSAATRAILPRVGYKTIGQLSAFARPLRPRLNATGGAKGTLRAMARFARNTHWAHAPTASIPAGWKAHRLGVATEWPTGLDQDAAILSQRTPAALAQIADCPDAAVRTFEVSTGDHVVGVLALSRVLRQMRLIDLRITTGNKADWATAVALAIRVAREDPTARELVADASLPALRTALAANGAHTRYQIPVFLHDPADTLTPVLARLHFQMLDGDAAFLCDPQNEFRS